MILYQFTLECNDTINQAIVELYSDYERDPWRMPHEHRLIQAKAEFVAATAVALKSKAWTFPDFDGILKYAENNISEIAVRSCHRMTKTERGFYEWAHVESGTACFVYVPNWQAPVGAVVKNVDKSGPTVKAVGITKFSGTHEPVDFFQLHK